MTKTRPVGHHGWLEQDPDPQWAATWRSLMGDAAVPRWFEHRDGRLAIVGREPAGGNFDDLRWHVSVRWEDPQTKAGRIPSWGEIVQTAHELRPGVVFVIGVPPRSWWMNVHEHVIHLWETRDAPLVEQYKASATGQAPT